MGGLQIRVLPPLLLLLSFQSPSTITTHALLREPNNHTSLTESAFSSSSLLREDGACPVVLLLPFSCGHGRWPAQANDRMTFDWLASAWLAMEHFNERNSGGIVPALDEMASGAEQCSVYFPRPAVLDSAMEGSTSVSALWRHTTTTGSRPCAVVGPMDPSAFEEVAPTTRALDLPHVSYFTELSKFWQKGPPQGNTIGMVLQPNARAHIMADWLTNVAGRDYLAVVHWGKDGSSDLADELQEIGLDDYNMIVETFMRQGKRHLPKLVDQVYESGISTILLNFDNPKSLISMANAFADRDMLTPDYVYLISPDALPTNSQRLNANYNPNEISPNLDKLLSRSLVFDILDPFRIPPQQQEDAEDPFVRAWQNLPSEFVQQINAANPLAPNHKSYWQAPLDYFQYTNHNNNIPSDYASIVYDSIILLGLNACKLQQQQQIMLEQQQDNTTRILMIDREALVTAMHNSSFRGASGPIHPFPEGEGYRTAKSDMTVGLYQIIPQTRTVQDENGTDTTIRYYEPTLTYVWSKDEWTSVPDTAIDYGTFTEASPPPALIPQLVENNYLSPHIRSVGFAIVGFTWAVAIGSIVAIVILQQDGYRSDTITRAQPFFLVLTCVGSLITSSAILALSWDENYVDAQDDDPQPVLNVACMSSMWTFFVGHVITFMALFSKLYRIDKVLQFRRNNVVSVQQVLGPLFAVLGMTLLILVCWTVLDPYKWERNWITRMPPETYGECSSDYFWAFFGPLMAIVVLAEGMTTFFALRTSDVPEDFSDSRSALFAIYTHVQSWVFGVPVLVVLSGDDVTASSVDGIYIARVLLIWIFSISSVVVVVGPRLYKAIVVDRRHGDTMSQSRVRVTGLNSYDSGGGGGGGNYAGRQCPASLDESSANAVYHAKTKQLQRNGSSTRTARLSGSTKYRVSLNLGGAGANCGQSQAKLFDLEEPRNPVPSSDTLSSKDLSGFMANPQQQRPEEPQAPPPEAAVAEAQLQEEEQEGEAVAPKQGKEDGEQGEREEEDEDAPEFFG